MKTAWTKVPPELAAAFDGALPDDPAVQRRQMFGCPCAFVNGHMFAGTHETRLIIRLPDEAAKRPCMVMGRTMNEYAAFDRPLALSAAERKRWLQRAFDFTRALLPKPPKPAKSASKPAVKRVAGPRKPRPAAKT